MAMEFLVLGLVLFIAWWTVLGLLYFYTIKRLIGDLDKLTHEQRIELLKTRRQRAFKKD
jgi:hypothetical protein